VPSEIARSATCGTRAVGYRRQFYINRQIVHTAIFTMRRSEHKKYTHTKKHHKQFGFTHR